MCTPSKVATTAKDRAYKKGVNRRGWYKLLKISTYVVLTPILCFVVFLLWACVMWYISSYRSYLRTPNYEKTLLIGVIVAKESSYMQGKHISIDNRYLAYASHLF